jgi:hypothetical protein
MSKGNKETKKPTQLHAPAPAAPVLPAAGAHPAARLAQQPKTGKR